MLSGDRKKLANDFLNRVEKYLVLSTSPKIVNDILENLHLSSFVSAGDVNLANFLKQITSAPLDMKPFIMKLKSELLDNKEFCEILAYIEENDLINEAEIQNVSQTLQLQINIICILESFVVTLANSSTFAEEIYQHIINRRQTPILPGNPITTFFLGTPSDAEFFEKIKLVSVDPAFIPIAFHRSMQDRDEGISDVRHFVNKYNLSMINANIKVANTDVTSLSSLTGMSINVAEAALKDGIGKSKGGIDNATAGLELIALTEKEEKKTHCKIKKTMLPAGVPFANDRAYALLPGLSIDDSPKKISAWMVDKEWRDMYNSWNFRFVIANIETVFLPLKLLLPSVFAAEPEHYKEARSISLFFLGNLFLNEKISKNPFFAGNFKFGRADEILSAWAKINKDCAEALLKERFPEIKIDADKLFENVFGRYPTANLFKYIFNYIYYGDDSRIIDNKLWSSVQNNNKNNQDVASNNVAPIATNNVTLFSKNHLQEKTDRDKVAGKEKLKDITHYSLLQSKPARRL